MHPSHHTPSAVARFLTRAAHRLPLPLSSASTPPPILANANKEQRRPVSRIARSLKTFTSAVLPSATHTHFPLEGQPDEEPLASGSGSGSGPGQAAAPPISAQRALSRVRKAEAERKASARLRAGTSGRAAGKGKGAKNPSPYAITKEELDREGGLRNVLRARRIARVLDEGEGGAQTERGRMHQHQHQHRLQKARHAEAGEGVRGEDADAEEADGAGDEAVTGDWREEDPEDVRAAKRQPPGKTLHFPDARELERERLALLDRYGDAWVPYEREEGHRRGAKEEGRRAPTRLAPHVDKWFQYQRHRFTNDKEGLEKLTEVLGAKRKWGMRMVDFDFRTLMYRYRFGHVRWSKFAIDLHRDRSRLIGWPDGTPKACMPKGKAAWRAEKSAKLLLAIWHGEIKAVKWAPQEQQERFPPLLITASEREFMTFEHPIKKHLQAELHELRADERKRLRLLKARDERLARDASRRPREGGHQPEADASTLVARRAAATLERAERKREEGMGRLRELKNLLGEGDIPEDPPEERESEEESAAGEGEERVPVPVLDEQQQLHQYRHMPPPVGW
ncbi:hypothetical protein CALCODRAFT_498268 [Calocera cornea HHB12733]|uniref:Uncharacterized protein n=1 Tax=Calocera cornea HHB12733 TaxID=1353952 RepID=A0A165EWM2_9BASI|nr:hypothetical protein CALCODRAFT_498268 [Calocera cornea HHB12733]